MTSLFSTGGGGGAGVKESDINFNDVSNGSEDDVGGDVDVVIVGGDDVVVAVCCSIFFSLSTCENSLGCGSFSCFRDLIS